MLVSYLLILLLAAGCGKDKQPPGEEEKIISVQTAAVEKGTIAETIMVTGKLEALAASDVVPGGQGGKVHSVNVELGDNVSKGQTLITLENAALAAVVRQAEQGVAQAESALELAKITFEQARANYERGKQLYESGAIPQAGQTGFETAYEIPYKQARIDFERVKPAALANARAALDSAREQYNNTFIKSPISGVVTAVNVNPGELASPASPVPVVSVASLDKVVVKAAVTESQINKIKRGQEVPVTISAVSDKPFKGVIANIAYAADPSSKTYPIKVQINNSGHTLKPGMFAEVQIKGEQVETLVAPREAVVKTGDKDVVWVVNAGRVTTREVTAGTSDGKKIQIIKGLKAGEQVVVSGQSVLEENAKVEVKSQVK